MTDDASVATAAQAIEADGGLDVLVNNAGIEGRTPDNIVIGAADETAGHMQACSTRTCSASSGCCTRSCPCCSAPPRRSWST